MKHKLFHLFAKTVKYASVAAFGACAAIAVSLLDFVGYCWMNKSLTEEVAA